MNRRTLICFVLIAILGCSKSDSVKADCQNNSDKRRGAKYKDGPETRATGSGARSGHDSVDYWLCK